MTRKSSSGGKHGRARALRLGLGLIAVFAIVGLSNSSASANDAFRPDACDSALISAGQAKGIASAFLRDMGYGSGRTALLRYDARRAICLHGQWRVSFKLSHAASRAEKAVVLVNCHSGEIEESVRGV